MNVLKRNFAVVLIAGLVVGGGAFAWAQSDTAGPSLDATVTAPAGDKTQLRACVQQARQAKDRAAAQKCFADAGVTPGKAGRAGKAGVLGRVVHGDLVVRGKQGAFEKVTIDKGTVVSVSDSSLTVKRPDGVSVTVKLTPDTKRSGEVKAGDRVMVLSRDGTALRVRAVNAKAPAASASARAAA
jgi:hypothetical protein